MKYLFYYLAPCAILPWESVCDSGSNCGWYMKPHVGRSSGNVRQVKGRPLAGTDAQSCLVVRHITQGYGGHSCPHHVTACPLPSEKHQVKGDEYCSQCMVQSVYEIYRGQLWCRELTCLQSPLVCPYP